MVTVAAHIEATVLGTLNGGASLHGEFWRAAINLHITQQGITARVFVPSLIRANLSTRNGNASPRIAGKRDVAAAEGKRMVGRSGIDAVEVVFGNHTVEGCVEIGTLEINACK